MSRLLANNYRYRRTYSKIPTVLEVSNLIEIQKRSYHQFLQPDKLPEEREDVGLQAVFKRVFPIEDFGGRASLQFVSYELEPAKYDVDECRERGMTYQDPIKVTVRLVVWDVDSETGTRTPAHIKQQPVYFGDIPRMTENGTFIINGTERVVVSQLHRSPGIFFDSSRSKTGGQKEIFSARIIPNQGSWIDFEFDTKDILYVRIDRRRKLPATVLLRALGYDSESLLNYFYESERVYRTDEGWFKETTADILFHQKAAMDIVAPDGSVIVKEDKKFLKNVQKKMRKFGMIKDEIRTVDGREGTAVEIATIPIKESNLIKKVSAYDIVDESTGKILVECNEELTEEGIAKVLGAGITDFQVLFIDHVVVGSFLRDTLLVDKIESMEEAIIEIYRRLRSSDPTNWDTALQHFDNLFFNSERYDLSRVGRHKLNHKLGVNEPLDRTTLSRQDILQVVKYLIDLKNNKGQVDDIDHLGNRRVRAVGELLENQYRVGLDRMGKAIKERMSLSEVEALLPNELINSKPVSAVIKEFFGSSQLSQFMDQTNPLSEITHKRRLSALGPGGLTRERAGFDVRDVHPTHYGRICPIETPEGPNIGLIASMSTFARVNEFGFIETPYRKVVDGHVTTDIIFMDAMDEDQRHDGRKHTIAQASVAFDESGKFTEDLVPARRGDDFILADPKDVSLMDVASNQLVSVAASLVPFLENDDANRALMGSNMQRQAVPVIRTEAPLVGTGIERVVARDSGVTVTCKRSGIVETVDASRIVVKTEEGADEEIGADVDIYNLTKFMRSNQNTCINQKPVVRPGDAVHAGDVIADGPATDRGELALGQNVVVAFMPWGGYNFEDSILISERLVREDMYTTIHIEEFEVAARETKLGKEEITRDIPNVGDEALKDLDDSGIVRIGAEVRPGDILVGKITPKGETQLSPEEKLLRAIFGEKAGDVRDTSLRVPPGVEGTVIGAQVFAREGVEKDTRALEIEQQAVRRIERDRDEKVRTIKDSALRQLARVLRGHAATVPVVDPNSRREVIAAGEKYSFENLKKLSIELYDRIGVEDRSVEDEVWRITDQIRAKINEIHRRYAAKVERLKKGDDLPPGVIKLVKVYVAIKRKLSVGDKMAGRHGNKGVISRIMPIEDMPFLEDGTSVDLVLNPLGVPSRMNVGQILETHLGWAARGLGTAIGDMLDRHERKELREFLKGCFADQPEVIAFVDESSDEDLDKFADKYRQGVTIATPVFSGANETEIRDALELAGFNRDGQSMVFDGRSGQAFHQRITVGVMYMLKLHHLVDDKIHARSIGPYSLVTQQPLGGKAQFGGQRLGEMEVWAMEAYGAAYGLQEFLTVKSDDVAGRTRMYESIVKGENVLEAGLPESFNVLVKEMQALALDVELIEDKEVLRQ